MFDLCVMRHLRSLARMIGFLLLCIATILVLLLDALWLKVTRADLSRSRALVHKRFLRFTQRAQRIMGLRIHWEGEPPQEPAVMMGNHRSYLDAILFPVKFPVVYVARMETKSWPIIGWGASLLGTIWVDRQNKDSRRLTRATVRERLAEGMGLVIFPEGTCHYGPDLLEYRPGMFYTCAQEGFTIMPVALEYKDQGLAWVDRTMFVPHAFKHFGPKHLDVAVRFGPLMKGDDAEKLREEVRNWTAQACLELRAQLDA